MDDDNSTRSICDHHRAWYRRPSVWIQLLFCIQHVQLFRTFRAFHQLLYPNLCPEDKSSATTANQVGRRELQISEN